MRAFEGIKVLDCTHVLAAPYATYQLALLGADVIKIENANDPDQARLYTPDKNIKALKMGPAYLTQSSNKRAVALDLKTKQGQEVLRRLAANWADVLVENFRPGAFKALGLGYDDLSKLNPKLIYSSMSAFGQDGPRGPQTAYDPAISASSGITASTGTEASGPIKGPTPVIDYATGMIGAFAISAALYQRMRTGEGQYIDMSMLDVALVLQGPHVTNYFQTGHHPKRGEKKPLASSSMFETKDGLIQLGGSNVRQRRRFLEAMEMKDSDGDYDKEWEYISKKMKEKTAAEWENILQSNHVPAARVRELPEMLADPQLKTRRVLHEHKNLPSSPGKTVSVPLAPFKFAHDGPSIERQPPRFGEHTDEVLALAGYSTEEIVALRSAKAVA